MDTQQNHYLIALSAQIELFNELTNRLNEWSDIIIDARHDDLAHLLNSNELNLLLANVGTSRTALKMLQQSKHGLSENLPVESELATACERLIFANSKLRIVVNRGLLFTRTMLNALAGNVAQNGVYNEFASSAWVNGNCLRGDA